MSKYLKNPETDFEGLDIARVTNSDKLIPELICYLCSKVLIQPISCQECEINFCRSCHENWFLRRNDDDPTCPNGCISATKWPYSFVFTMLSKLILKCKNEVNGCQVKLVYNLMNLHESKCSYGIGKCNGCKQIFLKKDIDEHETKCERYSINMMKLALERYNIDLYLANKMNTLAIDLMNQINLIEKQVNVNFTQLRLESHDDIKSLLMNKMDMIMINFTNQMKLMKENLEKDITSEFEMKLIALKREIDEIKNLFKEQFDCKINIFQENLAIMKIRTKNNETQLTYLTKELNSQIKEMNKLTSSLKEDINKLGATDEENNKHIMALDDQIQILRAKLQQQSDMIQRIQDKVNEPLINKMIAKNKNKSTRATENIFGVFNKIEKKEKKPKCPNEHILRDSNEFYDLDERHDKYQANDYKCNHCNNNLVSSGSSFIFICDLCHHKLCPDCSDFKLTNKGILK